MVGGHLHHAPAEDVQRRIDLCHVGSHIHEPGDEQEEDVGDDVSGTRLGHHEKRQQVRRQVASHLRAGISDLSERDRLG